MSTILNVYSTNAFKRFLLPAINDANYSILLPKGIFQLEENIELKLEVVDNEWFFFPTNEYDLRGKNKTTCFGLSLKSVEIARLIVENQESLVILVEETDNYFSVYQKYDIHNMKASLTIGNDSRNSIIYSNLNLVSIKHARFKINGPEAIFEDLNSVNGSFVNYRRVVGAVPLSFGDCIDIYGLRIVYLGDYLAINLSESGVKVNPKYLRPVLIKPPQLPSLSKDRKKELFHRAPRRIASIITDEIDIEEPPQPKELNQPSMFMTIAPALTMSLPMILGCALMIWATGKEGNAMNPMYQYVGMATAVSSALIGVVWALIAQHSEAKKFKKDKEYRNLKYKEYIDKKEQAVREQYTHNTEALYERYLSSNECCDFDVENAALWNRNMTQEDFLNHRVGIGDIPFQAEIKVPAEKFTLLEDDLAELPARIKETYSMLRNVPICVDLLKEKLVGLVGGKNLEGAIMLAQSLIAQIAANNAYTDVKLVIVYDEKKSGLDGEWDFAKWLPHVWNETGTFRYVASNKEEASEVFFELAKKIRTRLEEESNSYGDNKTVAPKPYYVLVVANPEALEGELVSKYVLEQDPSYGISTIYLAENYENLPNECELILQNDDVFQGMYRVTDDLDQRLQINYDPMAPALLEQLAQNLAGIEIRQVETGGDIPNALTFFDMYGVHKLSELNVEDRWRKNRSYETMKALVGQRAGEVDCYLDVHEKYHGPHGLVAGTTGSGKSETLQTYILSLCVNFSPNDVALFIIDYKGGGMGNLFTNLPHMIGQISNLSGNQIHRALVSIKSEKDRRQRIFNEYSVNNINSYTKLYKNNETKIPVPHLFIIIDEFAEMKRDEPDFIQELVSVSQVGRSLGIHLIMATQKPAGTVDDNIWSNSKFKLCLRVQDRQDSMDMLHKPDAAYITQAGRCYLQVGNDELYELFQSGWSGATYTEDEGDQQTDVAKMLSVDGVLALEGNRIKTERKLERKRVWITSLLQVLDSVLKEKDVTLAKCCQTSESRAKLMDALFERFREKRIDYEKSENNVNALNTLLDMALSEGMNVRAIIQTAEKLSRRLPEKAEKTQLDAVVEYLAEIAKKGFTYDFQLFLPLLSERILLTELPQTILPLNPQTSFNGTQWPAYDGEWTLAVSMGLFDDPENQRQDTFVLDIATAGNTAIVGSLATGKSTFLQTLIYGLTMRYTPEEVNIYAMDFSAKMLAAFEDAPHVGGIMYEDDTEKIAKFFAYLSRVLENRKKLLRGGSFEQYVTVHGRGSLPAILFIVDNYSGFQLKSGMTEQNEDFMLQLTKEGVSYGIFLLTTSAGFGHEELPNRMAENFRTTICLELNDTFGYTEVLRRSTLLYPEVGVKGRGIAIIEDRVLEFQTALSIDAESDYERSELLKQKMQEMSIAWTGQKAAPVPEIPEKPMWSEFVLKNEFQEMLATDNLLPLAYEARYADIYGVDLSKIYTFVISGAKRKGKTNALKALILSASKKGGKVIVIDYAQTLTKICAAAGATHITTEVMFYKLLSGLMPEIEKRNKYKHELLEQGLEEEELFENMKGFDKIYFFIDDLAGFINTTYAMKDDPTTVGEYQDFMEQLINVGAAHNFYWFVCMNRKEMGMADSYPLYDLFIRDKKGIHLGGMTDESPMNFDYISYRIRDQVQPAGRGFLPVDNEDSCQEIVIPLVKGNGA